MPRPSGAHLHVDNWPECIPWTEPTRKHWPQSWRPPDHDDRGLDDYGWSHPAAASISDSHLGDVCPYCGVPLRLSERVITISGGRGELWAVSPDDDPVPVYHPACWLERRGLTERTLDEFVDLGVTAQ